MSALVDYSSSSSEDGDDVAPPSKKRRVSATTPPLPPLPTNFRDLYSSTVRTSTQDDPSLHAGRKRVTPHVAGNWPAHVYLEWYPEQTQQALLSEVVSNISVAKKDDAGQPVIHSLLENELGVQLPLHVSLSRPLILKTTQKDDFLSDLTTSITATGVRAFVATPLDLIWHPNEDNTRWFLVLRLARSENAELPRLLEACNELAKNFGQPLLYQEPSAPKARADGAQHDSFHVSVAWSLQPQSLEEFANSGTVSRLQDVRIKFDEVKVRIGQDVTAVSLRKQRGRLFGDAT